MNGGLDSRVPNRSTAWQLWHHDTFDQDAPLSLQASGINILHGLYELWLCTLKEGILDTGSASFSRFHLTWGNTPAARVDVVVNPFNNQSLLKLRQWALLMNQDREIEEIQAEQRLEGQGNAIVLRLAQLHYEFLQNSKRWEASGIDWDAEAGELLAHVELVSDPKEL